MLTKLVNIGITGTWEEKYKNLINYSGSEQLMILAGDVDIDKIYRLDQLSEVKANDVKNP